MSTFLKTPPHNCCINTTTSHHSHIPKCLTKISYSSKLFKRVNMSVPKYSPEEAGMPPLLGRIGRAKPAAASVVPARMRRPLYAAPPVAQCRITPSNRACTCASPAKTTTHIS